MSNKHLSNLASKSGDWQQLEQGVYTIRHNTPAEDSVVWGRDVSYLDKDFEEWKARKEKEEAKKNGKK